jgi:hypothetical protein
MPSRHNRASYQHTEKEMGIETLEDVNKINGYEILKMDILNEKYPEVFCDNGELKWEKFDETVKPKYFITTHDKRGIISFTMQSGPIKEVGINGCQVDTLIHVAKHIIEGLNKKFPCRENSIVLDKLDDAIHWLDYRTKNREERGVEGRDVL